MESEPHYLLDSAQVLLYAVLDASVVYTGHPFAVVHGGGAIDPVPRLAIARNLYDDEILLLHCNERWDVLASGGYASVEAAQGRAETAYTGIGAKWQTYRSLTEAELAEVQDMQRFMRGESGPSSSDEDEG